MAHVVRTVSKWALAAYPEHCLRPPVHLLGRFCIHSGFGFRGLGFGGLVLWHFCAPGFRLCWVQGSLKSRQRISSTVVW